MQDCQGGETREERKSEKMRKERRKVGGGTGRGESREGSTVDPADWPAAGISHPSRMSVLESSTGLRQSHRRFSPTLQVPCRVLWWPDQQRRELWKQRSS